MGKVLDCIADDNEALAQWIGRKLKNHDPMSKRIASGPPIQVKSGTVMQGSQVPGSNPVYAVKGSVVSQHPADKTKIMYQTGDGKTFVFSVEQVFDPVNTAQSSGEKQAVLA